MRVLFLRRFLRHSHDGSEIGLDFLKGPLGGGVIVHLPLPRYGYHAAASDAVMICVTPFGGKGRSFVRRDDPMASRRGGIYARCVRRRGAACPQQVRDRTTSVLNFISLLRLMGRPR